MIDAAIESASSKSSAAAGSGTSMTKITLMAASGSAYSRSRCQNETAPEAGWRPAQWCSSRTS